MSKGRSKRLSVWVGNRRQFLYWRRGVLIDNGADVKFEDGRLLSAIIRGLAEEAVCAGAEVTLTVQAQVRPLPASDAPARPIRNSDRMSLTH